MDGIIGFIIFKITVDEYFKYNYNLKSLVLLN